jgi:hypothetical protein
MNDHKSVHVQFRQNFYSEYFSSELDGIHKCRTYVYRGSTVLSLGLEKPQEVCCFSQIVLQCFPGDTCWQTEELLFNTPSGSNVDARQVWCLLLVLCPSSSSMVYFVLSHEKDWGD